MTVQHAVAGVTLAAADFSAALGAAGLRVTAGPEDDTLTVEHGGRCYRLVVEDTSDDRPTNVAYQDWCSGESFSGAKSAPLKPDHPAYHEKCVCCHEKLGNGLPVRIRILGPTTAEARYAHWERKRYTPLGVLIHERCAEGEPRPEGQLK
ncbi:MAG: hypothetical protein ACRDTZ_10060 [Pseudonocardiaceae bacterium]